MSLKIVPVKEFKEGTLVTVKTMSPRERFCIIALKKSDKGEPLAVLKALFNDTYIIEKPLSELDNFLIKGLL